MKLGTIPTSPQHRPQPNTAGHLWIIFCSIIVGGVAGWCSAILAQLYPQWLPEESTSKVVFVKNDQENSTAQIAEVISNKSADTVVTLYPAPSTNFNEELPLGRGVLLSADGWIVTAQATLQGHKDVVVVLNDGRVFMSSQAVADPYNATTYLKISGSDLPIVNFSSKAPVLGELSVWYIPSATTNPTIRFGHITNTAFSVDSTFSTVRNNLMYLTDDSVANGLGAPVFNQSGEMIGLHMSQDQILPNESIMSGMYQVLERGTITKAAIDIEYQPMYWMVDPDAIEQTGIRITAIDSDTTLILPDDVIVSANNITLDEQNDFSTILRALNDQNINVTLKRDNTTQKIILPLQQPT